jgi:hypothetical protein
MLTLQLSHNNEMAWKKKKARIAVAHLQRMRRAIAAQSSPYFSLLQQFNPAINKA